MQTTKMILASLLVAACGSTGLDEGGGDAGPGSDGSGAGDDAGVPPACTAASDCESGYACDLSTHECVAGGLTIDPSDDVVDDGTRWWTTVSDPVVKGTFEGPPSTTIEVTVGTVKVTATVDGNAWSAKLPANSIPALDMAVTATMTSGGSFEATQLFRLDNAAPTIRFGLSLVIDERGDKVDFSTGEPVHTHTQPEIWLGGEDCPDVYKYPYLMTADEPVFGRQTSPNPLGWTFDIHEAKLTAANYRVRNANDQVLVDWKTLPVVNGQHRVELLRSDVAALASYDGKLLVDVLARDWTGRESTATKCIVYHALAAPVKIEAAQPATLQQGPLPALFGMSLPTDSPVSELSGIGMGAAVASQRIVQYSAEPIEVSLKGTIDNLRYARTYVDDYVAIATSPGSNCGAGCDWDMPADPADSTLSGKAQNQSFGVALLDEATNQLVVSFPLTIPARGADEAPRSYRLVAYLGQLGDLRPPQGGHPGEHVLANLTYTGLPPGPPVHICTETAFRSVGGELIEYCKTMTTFRRMIALDHASLQWDGVAMGFETKPVGGVAARPAHVPATTFMLGGMTWDAGNDDLPGPS